MKLIHAMMVDCDNAKMFAAKVVAAMIRLGCDPETMRRHEIPTSVFYGVLGGRKHCSGRAPDEIAENEMQVYKHQYLHNTILITPSNNK